VCPACQGYLTDSILQAKAYEWLVLNNVPEKQRGYEVKVNANDAIPHLKPSTLSLFITELREGWGELPEKKLTI